MKLMRADNESGFTLIELLTAMAIIGILSGIVSQQYNSYKSRAFDAQAESDLRHAITAEEAAFADGELYIDCDTSTCSTLLPSYHIAGNTNLEIVTRDGGQAYNAVGSHPSGEHTYTYDTDSPLITRS